MSFPVSFNPKHLQRHTSASARSQLKFPVERVVALPRKYTEHERANLSITVTFAPDRSAEVDMFRGDLRSLDHNTPRRRQPFIVRSDYSDISQNA
jgi:hypothetical protein